LLTTAAYPLQLPLRTRESAGGSYATRADSEIAVSEIQMWFILYYIVAITVLVLHFTGFLARHNLEWLVLVLAVTVFPAVIYL
jgi:hypothetical protein